MNEKTKATAIAPASSAVETNAVNFPVVGIGASAGGLEALQVFFDHLPAENDMAFVLVMHLSPDHDSVIDEILQAHTQMRVQQVTQSCRIQKNCVYISSPGCRLEMTGDQLIVKPAQPAAGMHVAIDLFFRDLACAHQSRAVGIVLSGSGSDGALGLARIKEEGGITLAQSPDDASFPGMPEAAIATGLVDIVLPVAQIPIKLVELWQSMQSIRLPKWADDLHALHTPVPDQVEVEQTIRDILALLRARTGHDFKHYKRATVLRRIERRMQVNAQTELKGYLKFLENNTDEAKGLLDDMLIGVTNFFRDREAFESLEKHVFGEILANAEHAVKDDSEIRIWSAGCSTGEEAFALAIVAAEFQARTQSMAKVQVFATDIDERAIAKGRSGIYPETIVADVSSVRLRQFFVKERGAYRVRKEVRESVLFAKHNLLSDPPFSQIDLIVCRNLLIYLDREIQREILQMFHFALKPGGILFLGSSEAADACPELFTPVDKRNRIYRAKTTNLAIRKSFTIPRQGYVRNEPEPLTPRAEPQRKVSFADVHQRALEDELPASLIVDSNAEILYMTAECGRFLRYLTGEVGRNVLSLITPALRLSLRTTLFEAQHSGKTVISREVDYQDSIGQGTVRIKAKPFKDAKTGHDVTLVIFLLTHGKAADSVNLSDNHEHNQVLASLEQELQRTKSQLQDTVEQFEVSSEELKASNEEMQAVNEELRSATEELETSKEELQSINEELLTVNHELKNKVEETDKINDYLANLITSTDIATVFVDRGMRIRWFTPRATEIFSMLPSDTGRSLLDITHRLDYPELTSDASNVFDSLSVIEREVRSQDGRWYIARLLPYRASESHIDGTVLTFIDISSRRAAEEDLRLGQERMRLVAESTHEFAIIVLDEQGRISDWNTGAEIIFRYNKHEVIGEHYSLIFTEDDIAAGIPEQELQTARLKGRGKDERWHVRKDGHRFYCSGEVAVLQGEKVKGYVKIARDLTGHKRIHDEQSRQLEEKQSSSNLKDEFFAVMSHELKHPLNLIQLNVEMLRRLPAVRNTERAKKAVLTISDAVSSQARIIDDLLDVARIRTGKLKLKMLSINLTALLTDIHAVAVSEYPESLISLEMHANSPVFISGDITRIEQILWNLLNNALKFSMPDPRIKITLALEGGDVVITVSDNGIGLSPGDSERIFDLFKQATASHARQYEGLGIGLSLVRQLVQAHQGTVTVNSAGVGQGCTFTVRLPVADTTEACDRAGIEAPQHRLAGLKVLLVDDSVEVLNVMQMLLEDEQATVNAYSDPLRVVEDVRDSHYDVIISDIGMPGMDGYQLVEALRKLPQFAKTPALALSGFGDHQHRHRAKEAGFQIVMSKPVQYEELIESLERVWNQG
ncbi:CheR family methyltransferase [Pseudomonas sp. NPDC090233]|uniref:CheR family methyltransferase n=1 Tax=Pseudomonas sp. NPDC090233 TaxID=3364479 RepID=UPI00383B8D14